VLEALASGLPVVGLDADGTRDLVQHERTGLLLQYRPNQLESSVTYWNDQFNPGSLRFQVLSRQYAALLRRLVCNVILRSVMGECASASAPVGRSWDVAMGCMVECYHEVAQAGRQSGASDGVTWSYLQLRVPISIVCLFYCLAFLLCLFRYL
jgi:glycosyltransferase involved in cell wall biosynthesis